METYWLFCWVTPSIKFVGTHLYTWVERGTVRVKCLAQEHSTMSPARARTRTARSGDERTNHEATAPPSVLATYFIIKFTIFDLCVIIDLVLCVIHCFINSIQYASPTPFASNLSVDKVSIVVKLKSHSKWLDCTTLLELIPVSVHGSADKG